MGNTSAAEAKLDARIRPEIAVLRSRTSYPRRARGRAASGPALAALREGADAGQAAGHAWAIAEARGGGAFVAAAAVVTTGSIAVAGSVLTQPDCGPDDEVTAVAAAGCSPGRGAVAGVTRPGAATKPVARGAGVSSGAGFAAGAPISAMRAGATEREPGAVRRGQPRQLAKAGPVRLTRRGKIVVGALVALAVAGLTVLIWFAIAGQAEAAGPAGLGSGAAAAHTMTRVVVRPGDTLWSIAVRADPTADPRAVIQEIIDDNALRGTAIQVGQVLYVPRT